MGLLKFFQKNITSSDTILNLEWIKILLVVFILYIIRFYYKYFTRINPLNGPTPLPLIGNLHLFGLELSKDLKKLSRRYGSTFEIYLMTRRFIVVSDPKEVEKVFNNSPKNKFFNRPELGSSHEYNMNTGMVFNNNYPTWRYNRKLTSQVLLSPRILKEFVTTNQQHFDKSMKYWQINHGTKKEFVVNIVEWARAYTTDLSFKLSTGMPTYSSASYSKISLDDVKNEEKCPQYLIDISREFSDLVNLFIRSFIKITLIPSFIQNYFLKDQQKKWIRNFFRIKEALHLIVKERRKEIEKEPLNEQLRPDLLTNLLLLNTENDKNNTFGESPPMNDQQIVANLLETILGGIDTTGNMISLVFNLILSHKEVKEKILEEINQVFADDLKRPMTYEDYEKMEYSLAVVKEVLRYHALVSVLFRQAKSDNAEIGGYNWPAGTVVLVNIQELQKTPNYWEDADQFKPERFLKDEADKIGKYTYTPFGGGIRICPGHLVGKITMVSLLVNLLRNYDIEYYEKENPFKFIDSFITIVTDFKVILKPKN
ncbi:8919_t:CDS:2 [Entrophospora sp. SA101]|nr:11985_t:CDS:2 [Entrophospora sp. SA101]CAJ0639480.1 8919_t:CDS:2 [Entrophospora sp. SA101]CAJ0840980.1 1966_t:CDS:2 [Entrophospora sp. SA101]